MQMLMFCLFLFSQYSLWSSPCQRELSHPSAPHSVVPSQRFLPLTVRTPRSFLSTSQGILTEEGHLVCPWHGACFNAKNGDIEDSPALDSLLSFPVEVDSNGDVYVSAEEEQLKGKPGKPVSCSGSIKESKQGGLVIVGGGSVGIHAIESARKNGYSGPITLVTSEEHAPYDRTKLSKGLIADASAVIWRSPSHLEKVLKVKVKTGTSAESLLLSDNKVKLSSGEELPYEHLVLATGGIPKRLPLPGAKEGELENVHLLRGLGHVEGILESLGDKQDKDVVVIGSSFIGMEAAIAMAGQKKAKSVSVVGMEGVPLEGILGAEVGKGIKEAQEKNNGLKFYMEAGVQSLEGDGKVSAVKIKDSDGKEVSIKADVVLLGVGVGPATNYLKESKGFPELEKDGSVLVDSSLRVQNLSSSANIFAAGDIATFPSFNGKEKIRIEHWNVAGNQGRAIGETIANLERGEKTARKYEKLPIFWSAMGGQLRFVSDGNNASTGNQPPHVEGSPAEGKFVAYYTRGDGKVSAVASMGWDPVMVQSAELMKRGTMGSFDDIKSGKFDPLKVELTAQ